MRFKTAFKLKKGAKIDDRMVVHFHVYVKKLRLMKNSERKNFLWLINYDKKRVGYYRAVDIRKPQKTF